MSRQGLGLGQAWVATRSPCIMIVFPMVGHSCRYIRFYVATGFSKGSVTTGCFSVATYRTGPRVRQGIGHAHDRPELGMSKPTSDDASHVTARIAGYRGNSARAIEHTARTTGRTAGTIDLSSS